MVVYDRMDVLAAAVGGMAQAEDEQIAEERTRAYCSNPK